VQQPVWVQGRQDSEDPILQQVDGRVSARSSKAERQKVVGGSHRDGNTAVWWPYSETLEE